MRKVMSDTFRRETHAIEKNLIFLPSDSSSLIRSSASLNEGLRPKACKTSVKRLTLI